MKKGDVRREQILLTAESLFYVNGYEQTSVQDILDALHFSKGGFYHHFDSKLSLLDAISDMRAQERFEAAKAALLPVLEDPVQALNTLIDRSSVFHAENVDYVAILLHVNEQEDGALIHEKLHQRALELLLPLMNQVVSAGVAQRVFLVPYPSLAGELILRLCQQFAGGLTRILAERGTEMEKLADAFALLDLYRHTVERMISAPFGSVILYDGEGLSALVQALEARRIQAAPGRR